MSVFIFHALIIESINEPIIHQINKITVRNGYSICINGNIPLIVVLPTNKQHKIHAIMITMHSIISPFVIVMYIK